MIYLTVGSFPGGFDRLVAAVDRLCGKYAIECVAQIGRSTYTPTHMKFSDFYDSAQHIRHIESAQAVITHGGFGVIGDLMRLRKPFLIVPRKPDEGPNDQRESAVRLAEMYNLKLCMEIDELEPHFVDLLGARTSVTYELGTDIPSLIAQFLQNN